MSDLFYINGMNQVMVREEALLVPEFALIWKADKVASKPDAMRDFAYLYYVSSLKSPYRRTHKVEDIPEAVKEHILQDKKYKPHKRVEDAIKVYDAMQETKSKKVFKLAENYLDKALTALSNVGDDVFIEDIDKIMKLVGNVKKLISDFESSRKAVLDEIDEGERKDKTGKELGDREIPKRKNYDD